MTQKNSSVNVITYQPMISLRICLRLALVLASLANFEVNAVAHFGNECDKLNIQRARRWKPFPNLCMRGGDSPVLSSAETAASSSQTNLGPKITGGSYPSRKKKRRRKVAVQDNGIQRATSLLNSNPIASSPLKATKSTTVNDEHEDSTVQKMPTLFSEKEGIFDRYAAALAATESLRRIRDSYSTASKRGLRSAVNVDSSSWKSWLSKDGAAAAAKDKHEDDSKEAYKRACAQYVLNSSKAIHALGLSVSQFNQLGRTVAKDDLLKERVMEQAYLYRMASTINMKKIPLIEDPNSKQLLKSHKRRRVQMFVRSITEIEELRNEQIERLKRVLQLKSLPKGIDLCDPAVLPLLSPKVRAVCEAFPHQAEEIVKQYGLNSDEFNGMLEETRGNPIFRWRVEKFRKLHDQSKNGSKNEREK